MVYTLMFTPNLDAISIVKRLAIINETVQKYYEVRINEAIY